MQTTQYVAQPQESSLGFVEFVPTDDVALIEANVDGRTLRFQVEDTSYATSMNQPRPQGKARVSVQAQGNRLSINIDFPASSRLSLPRSDFVSAESRQLQVTPPEVRASAMAPAAAPMMAAPILTPASRQAASEDDDDESSSLSDSEVSQRATPMPARDLEPAPRMPANTQKSEVPLFERAVREQEAQAQREATEAVAREPVMRASGGAAAGGAAPQPFGAVVQSLTADHEAMAMHRVSEDDARIKGRRQEGRIEEAVARHARPSATGHGIDMAKRKSIDTSRRPSLAAGEPGADGRPSMQSEQLDDVEYTKDEELERLKGFWRKIFHKKGSTKNVGGSSRNVAKA